MINHPECILTQSKSSQEVPKKAVVKDLKLCSILCKLRIAMENCREQIDTYNMSYDIKDEKKEIKNEFRCGVKLLGEEIRNSLISNYGNVFEPITRQKEHKDYDDVLSAFYEKKILTGKALCNYKGDNGCTLKSFLVNILIKFINTHIKKTMLRNERNDVIKKNEMDRVKNKHQGAGKIATTPDGREFIIPEPPVAEQLMDQNTTNEIITEALELLKQDNPEDEKIVRSWMMGISFEEIIRREYSINDSGQDPQTQKKLFAQENGRLRNRFRIAKKNLNIYLATISAERTLMVDNDFSFIDQDINMLNKQKRLCDEVIHISLELFSKKKPTMAWEARQIIRSKSTARVILLFGLLYGEKKPRKITKKRPPAINALHPFVHEILSKKGLIMTIERGHALIRKAD